MPQPPAIPPRPARNPDKSPTDSPAPPKIPPRPTRRLERAISGERFAPSPLNEGLPSKKKHLTAEPSGPGEPVERPGSVTIPSLGEEGAEYAALEQGSHHEHSAQQDPEQTRTIGGDVKLHAPKPSLPVSSAKQRVAAVTRIDSNRAASFGIGQARNEDTPSLHKRTSPDALSSAGGADVDEDHGIPEIGLQVPMYPNAGDVQAPSPTLQPLSPDSKTRDTRGHSGHHGDLPSGSHGLHGHGVTAIDRLDKAYHERHLDLLHKEHPSPYHERENDFSMSSTELNQIIRDTASSGSGLATSNFPGTPSEEVGYQAHEEYVKRVASPQAASAAHRSSLAHEVTPPNDDEQPMDEHVDTIHVDEPHHTSTAYRAASPEALGEQTNAAPILAEDEVVKSPPRFDLHAAVEPSTLDVEEPTSRPVSRHTSRPPSAQNTPIPIEIDSTPLEDVKKYEPLFDEEGNQIEKPEARSSASPGQTSTPPRFPSKDVWEDAPSSAHQTAVVSTPDVPELPPRMRHVEGPARDGPTPAQAFARHQEELAEKEAQRMESFVPRGEGVGPGPSTQKPSSWMPQQPSRLSLETQRPTPGSRGFPSRDVWEDAPESHMHQTTVSSDQTPESPTEQPHVAARPLKTSERPSIPERRPSVPERPSIPERPTIPERPSVPERPSIPARPKPKKTPSDEARPKPAPADKPKPQLPARPARPVRATVEAREAPTVLKAKPALPARPAGGKIAALQAGFMSDLNRRLQLGPSAPKKEEVAVVSEQEQEKKPEQKVPLSDARKGRARGPQRRAPARAAAAAPAAPATAVTTVKAEGPSLSFSTPQRVWSIDPDDVLLSVHECEDIGRKESVRSATSEGSSKRDAPVIDIAKDGAPQGDDTSAAEPAGEEAKTEAGLHENSKSEPLIMPVEEPADEDTSSGSEPLGQQTPKGERLGDLPSASVAETTESERPSSAESEDATEGEGEKTENETPERERSEKEKVKDDKIVVGASPTQYTDEPVDAAEFSEENKDAASKLWGKPR